MRAGRWQKTGDLFASVAYVQIHLFDFSPAQKISPERWLRVFLFLKSREDIFSFYVEC